MLFLTTAFCPPIEYFALLAKDCTLSSDGVLPSILYLEAKENYQKQSYRNRCRIYSANGILDLNIPIVHNKGEKIPIQEVQIDYSTPWLLQFKRAVSSAYDSSSFFEYYKDEFFDILDSKPKKLWDLNKVLLEFFIKKIGIKVDFRFTEDWQNIYENQEDYRYLISPKKSNNILKDLKLEKPYFQVFAQKYGFISNLSIMDLLFNEGPNSILFLKSL